MTGPVTSVVFDLGGVLVDWDPRYLYRRLFKGDEKKVEWFLAEICTPEWNHRQDAGRGYAEAEAELIARYPAETEAIRAWREYFDETMRGEIPGSVALLAELQQQNVALYALTNWPKETFPVMKERFAFTDWFNGIVVSGQEGVAKPDARLFKILIERYRLEPEKTIYIDDKKANIDTAKSLGFIGLLFTTPRILAAELRRFNLLSLQRCAS